MTATIRITSNMLRLIFSFNRSRQIGNLAVGAGLVEEVEMAILREAERIGFEI